MRFSYDKLLVFQNEIIPMSHAGSLQDSVTQLS